MPNIKSAKKRVKTTKRDTEKNIGLKSEMRTAMKQCRQFIESGDQAKAQEKMNLVFKLVDRNASKKILHRRAAARIKRRISRDFKAKFEAK